MKINLVDDFIFYGHPIPIALQDPAEYKRLTDFLEERVEMKKYPKGKHLLVEGVVPRKIYFLPQGIVEGYKETPHGQHKILYGWVKNAILTDARQFAAQAASTISIRVISSHTEIISLSYKHISELIEQFPYTRVFLEIIAINNLHNSNREIITGKMGPEKLRMLRQQWPGIELYAPRSFLADLIHVTPQYWCQLVRDNP